jgi:hypothetical protein
VREKVTAVVLLVVLGFYAATIGWRGVELVRDGRPAAVALGLGVILVPIVAIAAMVPLVRFARDGARMMARAREHGAQDAWGEELASAEECRLARDRRGEQRHYRAAVRAWRTASRDPGSRPSPSR